MSPGPTAPLLLQKVSRVLACKLTADEVKACATRAATLSAEAQQDAAREERAKAAAQSARRARAEKEREALQMLDTYQRGTEQREVEVREEFNGIEVVVIRTDTDAEIERRAPTPQDRERITAAQQRAWNWTETPPSAPAKSAPTPRRGKARRAEGFEAAAELVSASTGARA